MTVKTISYKKIFPIASYVNESIGVEISVDGTDDWEETFAFAKKIVNKWGAENQVTVNPEYAHLLSNIPSTGTTPHVQPPVRNLAAERLEILIEKTDSIGELKVYESDAIKYGLTNQYETKLKSLQ